MRIALALLLCACGKSDTKPAEKAPTQIVVTSSGTQVTMSKALVTRRADGRFAVLVTDDKTATCDKPSNGTTIVISSLLDAHGKDTYKATAIAMKGVEKPLKASAAFVGDAAAAKGKVTPIQLDVAEHDSELAITIAAHFDAEGCGDAPAGEPVTKTAHPSTAVMWVATRKFPVLGATLHGDVLRLADAPLGCASTAPLGVTLSDTATTWTLDGARFAGESVGDAPELKVTPGANGTSDDGPTLQLALAGAAHLGDYNVVLEGNVEALDCK